MKLNKFFSKHPVFTVAELIDFLKKNGSGNRLTRTALLAHHQKQGHILSIRRGVYAVVPAGSVPQTYPVDPYLAASKMAETAVLAYHTALEFYGKAYSVYGKFIFLTDRLYLSKKFRSYQFCGVPFPKALRDKKQKFFGVNTAERSGISLKVTGMERTLVDVLDRPKLSGAWEEIWRSLEMVEFFDLDKVVKYTLLLGNATTTAKVGFFLEQHQKALMVTGRHLKLLRKHRPKHPHYMVRRSRKEGRFLSDWNLVVPLRIFERSWQEVT